MQLVVTVYVPSSLGVHVVEPKPEHVGVVPESIRHAQNEHPLGNDWQVAVALPPFVTMSQYWFGAWHVGPPSPHVNEAGVCVPQPSKPSESTSRRIIGRRIR